MVSKPCLGNWHEDQSHTFTSAAAPASSAAPLLNLTPRTELVFNNRPHRSQHSEVPGLETESSLRTAACCNSVFRASRHFLSQQLKKKNRKNQGWQAVLAAREPESGSPPKPSCALSALRKPALICSEVTTASELCQRFTSFRRDLTGGPWLCKSVHRGLGLSI